MILKNSSGRKAWFYDSRSTKNWSRYPSTKRGCITVWTTTGNLWNSELTSDWSLDTAAPGGSRWPYHRCSATTWSDSAEIMTESLGMTWGCGMGPTCLVWLIRADISGTVTLSRTRTATPRPEQTHRPIGIWLSIHIYMTNLIVDK